MKLVHRHGRCVGITLFRWGRHKLELWFCKEGEVIESHVHENIHSKIVVLLGGMSGHIGSKYGNPKKFRVFSVPAGVRHGAVIRSQGMCVFANFETWKEGVPMTSAADDFSAV